MCSHQACIKPVRRRPAIADRAPALAAAGDASEVLNERAMTVMRRMTDKLMGRDHIVEGSSAAAECDSVPAQVQRLIAQAISHENLCQSYIGWCPFW